MEIVVVTGVLCLFSVGVGYCMGRSTAGKPVNLHQVLLPSLHGPSTMSNRDELDDYMDGTKVEK